MIEGRGPRSEPLVIPTPRSHLLGTLRLVDVFEALTGAEPALVALRRFVDRPEALPSWVRPEENSLKYDAYLTRHAQGFAWGLSTCDRYDDVLPLIELIEGIGGRYRPEAVRALEHALAGSVPPMQAVAVGFDRPGVAPRIKVYFQEARWGEGIGTAAAVQAALAVAAPGCCMPAWVADDRPVGVVTIELRPDARITAKAYLGGASPEAAAGDAPAEARALARTMAEVSTLPGGYFYLTLRLDPERPCRYAMNRIYNHVQLGFADGGAGLDAGWADVARQFECAGQAAALHDLRARVGAPDLRVVPTASALEDEARSADVYFAAWVISEQTR
jgi:hypothetical protein